MTLLATWVLFLGGCARVQGWLHPGRCCLDGRPIHPGMAVAVEAEGGPTGKACCLRCAIRYAEQTQARVRVLWVTDYVSHEHIRPDRAVFVSGSRVAPCAGAPVEASASRRDLSRQSWDRCLPGVIAFAAREDGHAFQEQSGGSLLSFAELVQGANVSAGED